MMNIILLFHGSGNWMGFMLILIVMGLIFIGVDKLIQYIRNRYFRRNPRLIQRTIKKQ